MYTITLPVFEGPLDLLLHLIERSKLDITKIALAQVADQYLAHVRALEAPDGQALADFIALAARLLLIKSRVLLPRPTVPTDDAAGTDADDAEALAQQLREYRRYKQIAGVLRSWQDEGRRTFLRTAAPPYPAAPTPPELEHTVAELVATLERRIQLSLPLEDTTSLPLSPRLTVAEVAVRIHDRLMCQAWFSLEDLLSLSVTRQEIVVTFWAVLELLKRRAIVVEQDGLFGGISIGRGADLEGGLASLSGIA